MYFQKIIETLYPIFVKGKQIHRRRRDLETPSKLDIFFFRNKKKILRL
jgi:hypothetical protein